MVQFLSYLELYANGDEKKYIDELKKGVSMQKAVAYLDDEEHTFKNHQRHFRKKVDTFLKAVLGDEFSLDLCLDQCPTYKNHGKTYEIRKNELYFFMFLYVTHQDDNAKNFLNQKYALVDDRYFQLLRFGIEDMIKNRPTAFSMEMVDYVFDIKYGLYVRKLKSDIIHLEEILDEIVAWKMQGENALHTYSQCEMTIEECERGLMKIRNETFPTCSPDLINFIKTLKNAD